jgi:hypothetical protein
MFRYSIWYLCNGTRLQIKLLRNNIIEAVVLIGPAKGEIAFIPRILMIPSNLPFSFKRLQFPVKVSFSITINKAQGQTFKYVGVDLRTECFSRAFIIHDNYTWHFLELGTRSSYDFNFNRKYNKTHHILRSLIKFLF